MLLNLMTIVIILREFVDGLSFLFAVSMNIKAFQNVKICNLVDSTKVSDDLAASIFVLE